MSGLLETMMQVEGKKFDLGKPKLGMVVKYFANALTAVAECGTYGQMKYAPNEYWDHNWGQVKHGQERYQDALMRHFLSGEKVDSESGLRHKAHIAWNALADLELEIRNEKF
jgi:hypothetical protein